jgi:hypothetical protein
MLRPGGSIVSIVEPPDAERADVNCLLFVVEPNGEQLTKLARRIGAEGLFPVVGDVGALSEGPRRWANKVAGGHLLDVLYCLLRRLVVGLGRRDYLTPVDVAVIVVLVLGYAAATVGAHGTASPS